MEDTIEGRNPVLEALKAQRAINKLLLSKDMNRHTIIGQIIYQARQNGIQIEYMDPRAIQRLSPTGHSQGVIALVAAKNYVDIQDLFEISRQKNVPPLYVVLDGIEDPHNLGAIIRTADAAGVHGIIIPKRRAAGLTAAVARASAGAVEHVPVAKVTNISQTIKNLGDRGIWSIGIDSTGDKSYMKPDYRQPVALVIGAEGKGLSRLVKQRCDILVSIPMKGRISSLNASVAAALAMYEADRQRSSDYNNVQ